MNAINEAFPLSAAAGATGVTRLITAGSVDDGKSTLIGRLLYDSKGVFADQLDAIARAKYKRVAEGLDLSLLTDGLEAEREQGITIDVAYRYFATPRRKFIIADAPGHEQYTRNMVTGASTADVAIVLIDATRAAQGQLLTQTKRHSALVHLLGIRHIVVAINKMDLVAWDRAVYERICTAYAELARRVGISGFQAVPLSALLGDNVVTPSAQTPWYQGPPLLELLESVLPVDSQRALADGPLRFPVQWVARHGGATAQDFRAYAGRLASGRVAPGDAVVVQPSGLHAQVRAIHGHAGTLPAAISGDSIMLELDRDIDVSRGDVLCAADQPAVVGREFEADVCWLDATPLNLARRYLIKQGTRLTSAQVRAIQSVRDIHELQEVPATRPGLEMNEIARVKLSTRDALAADAYDDIPAMGAFVLIDAATHQTAAAGMLRMRRETPPL